MTARHQGKETQKEALGPDGPGRKVCEFNEFNEFTFAIQSDRLTARHRRNRIKEIHNIRNERINTVVALVN